jgi:hypothetical protein
VLKWLGRLGLPAYLALLVYRAVHGVGPEPVPLPSMAQLGAAAALLKLLRELMFSGALEVVRFAPLGILAALAMSRREGLVERALKMALPAVALSLAAAIVVGVADGGPPWTMPGLLELAIPSLGVRF